MADSHITYLAKRCIKDVQSKWGKDARARLGPVLYEALVAREVVSVVMAQALDLLDEKGKASAAEHMQEVAVEAMRLADPEC